MLVEKLLRTEDVATLLGVPAKTLEMWRYRGTGPRFVKLGRLVRYAESDLAEWMLSRTRSNTAEQGRGGAQ